MELKVSKLCDRYTTTIAKAQSGRVFFSAVYFGSGREMCDELRVNLHSCSDYSSINLNNALLHYFLDFFSYMALPLFKAWSELFSNSFSAYLCNNIVCNKAYWDSKMAVEQERPPCVPENTTLNTN